MKIYRVFASENGVICCYAKDNRFNVLDFENHYDVYMDADKPLEDWNKLHFYTSTTINKRKRFNNIMRHNVMFYMVDESSKMIIEKEFSDCIQFLEAVNNDDPLTKYYFLYPFRGIEGLDTDKSKCDFLPNSKIYTSVSKYIFRKDVEYCPVFKLKSDGKAYDMRMYVTDEFKNFIESNGITGLRFEEIFDFED